jgi:spore germination cell wall hydrolase CwlJ-like protein
MLLGALTVAVHGKTTEAVANAHPPTPRVEAGDFGESLECLALNIYHEARSESETGQLAVAAVTLNRVQSEAFPDLVCDVVQQGGERLHRCQFSWWCDGKSDRPTEARAWERARRIARRTLLGGLGEDPTGGALYYHASYAKPPWSREFERTARIGNHVFYRPRSEDALRLAALE